MTNRNSFSNPEGRQQNSNYAAPGNSAPSNSASETPSNSASENGRMARDEFNSRPATEDELAYRDGYVEGRNEERLQVEEVRRTREANSVGAGAIIGVLMATVAGLVLAMLYLTPRQQTVFEPTGTQVPTAPLSPVPASPVPSGVPITPAQPQVGTAQPSSPVPNQITVIERVQESPIAQPQAGQPQIAQPQLTQPVQPQIAQPQVSQPQVAQPTVQPGVTTDFQGQPLVPPTSPTDPYQSPQPSVITPPGSVGQP